MNRICVLTQPIQRVKLHPGFVVGQTLVILGSSPHVIRVPDRGMLGGCGDIDTTVTANTASLVADEVRDAVVMLMELMVLTTVPAVEHYAAVAAL